MHTHIHMHACTLEVHLRVLLSSWEWEVHREISLQYAEIPNQE